MRPEEEFDDRLARLARATEDVGPRAGFVAKAMAAVEEAALDGTTMNPAKAGNWEDEVRIPARRMIPIAALAAILSLVFAARTASAFDDALIESVEEVEESW